MAKAVELEVVVVGSKPLLLAFKQLPEEATARLIETSQKIARMLEPDVEAAARSAGGQAALMASTVKVGKARVPVLQVGGAKRVGRRRVQAGALLYGSEWGGKLRKQFKPFKKAGYFFFSTVDARDSEIYAQWMSAADDILNDFGGHRG